MFAIAQHLRHIPVTRYRHRHQPTGSPLAERILLLYLPDSRLQDCELHPFFRITDCNASLSKRDSTRGCPGVTGTSSMPLHKRKKGAPIHDESWTASGLAQCPGCVAASGETRRIPRLPPLSLCGTPQGGSAGRPHQTVARPFAKLNRPLRGATAVRRDLAEGMVRESWFGI